MIHFFREGAKFASQGKLGCAILASSEKQAAQLILYRTASDIVATAPITPTFSFKIQERNFANFADQAQQSWSINFKNEEELKKFSLHLALAKFLTGGQKVLVAQDSTHATPGAQHVGRGDTIVLRYAGFFLQPSGLCGASLDTSSGTRAVVGARGQIPGWADGLSGMAAGQTRAVIIPYDHAYGAAGVPGRIPPAAPLAFEMTVVSIEQQAPKQTPAPAAQPAPTPTPQPAAQLPTQPGVQLYTSNFLTPVDGKEGVRYDRRSSFCLETQGWADAIHHPDFPSIVLKAGETYHQVTEYKVIKEN